MEQNQQPAALLAADALESIGRALGDIPSSARQIAIHELRHLHARNQELEAMLDAIGAGGVPAQRITQAKNHIEQDRKMVAAPVLLPEPVAVQVRHIKEESWRIVVLDLYNLFAGGAYERRYLYNEQQVRDLLDKADCTKSQTTAQEPFGYFKAEPFGWRDCAETDEGVIALYEAPHPQADARDAERVHALYKALEVCSAELFAQCAHQGRAMKYVEQARKALAAEQCARAAIAAAKEGSDV